MFAVGLVLSFHLKPKLMDTLQWESCNMDLKRKKNFVLPPNAANSFSFHPIRSSIFYHSIAIRFYFNAWIYMCSSCLFSMYSCACIATVARHGDGNCCGSNVSCNVLNFQRTAKQLYFHSKMISIPWKWVETKHLILHSIRVMGCFNVCSDAGKKTRRERGEFLCSSKPNRKDQTDTICWTV